MYKELMHRANLSQHLTTWKSVESRLEDFSMWSVTAIITATLFAQVAIGQPPNDSHFSDVDIDTVASGIFGNRGPSTKPTSRCKAFPGETAWPSVSDWASLNRTLGGVLLNPSPPASVCYPTSASFNTTACNFLFNGASQSTFWFDDPVTVQGTWPQGLTCPLVRNPQANATCTRGGYPVYVVNATQPKHVQSAVNFAREKNVRLIIKNTGHDFLARNIGAGSLSIWTHNLRGFEFISDYKQPGGRYRGPAAWVGAGLQVYDAFRYALAHNITLPAASCLTIGSYGGWISGGGHSPLSSKYGLGVDQVLELKVVTADGKYVTANPTKNEDLFFAFRGGGGSTYGVITSAIVKAHPAINLTIASFNFNLGNTPSSSPSSNPTITNSTAFWLGFNAIFAFAIPVVDAGGYLWTNGLPSGPGFAMQVQVQMPGLSPGEALAFTQPLLDELNGLGIPVANITVRTQVYSSQSSTGAGGAPGAGGYFASRLFPRAAYVDPVLFSKAMNASRVLVEAGYTFHGLNMAPTLEAAGHPYPAGVNPVWRESVMHADIFGFSKLNLGTATDQQVIAAQLALTQLMEPLKEATPGGGSYLNEGDPHEPNWQQSFYGDNYSKLVRVKKTRDPWGVFWAPTTPGSEEWKIEGEGGLLWRQSGRLCRV